MKGLKHKGAKAQSKLMHMTKTSIVGIALLLGTMGCTSQQSFSTLSRCRTYYTLSTDKKVLTWHHECPPHIKHLLWTANPSLKINRWHKLGTIEFVAFGRDIRISKEAGVSQTDNELRGTIVYKEQPLRVFINLFEVKRDGKVCPYLRNGEYDLILQQRVETSQ